MKVSQAVAYLEAGIAAGRFGQAYIVEGAPRAEGLELAEQALLRLFCGAGTTPPCGTCRECRLVTAHTHPDVLWIRPQKKSRLISIGQVRDMQSRIFQTSLAGGWKACVCMAADRLGREAANAFLKTLEEPPPRSVFFLLTDSPQSLLPTILSRCQRVTLSGGGAGIPPEWREELLDILAADQAAYGVGALARAGRVAKLLERVAKAAEAEETEASAGEALDEDKSVIEARVSSRYRELRSLLVRGVLLWYRDLMMLACGAGKDVVEYDDRLDVLSRKADALSYRRAYRNLGLVEEMNRRLEGNVSEGPVLTYAFARLT